jgi:NDP-sugar pyrophosphorylase family protein
MILTDYVARAAQYSSFFVAAGSPWPVIAAIPQILRAKLAALPSGYRLDGDVAVHTSAEVEPGAIIKGPAIIGPHCFVAAGAYLRGGVWLEERCIIGPGAELKTSLMFSGSKLAHFNFVGDSILGDGVNLEAGSIVANYRNEMTDKRILIATPTGTVDTGLEKAGAVLGDRVRLGANAVIAPGALLKPGTIVGRLQLIDQHPAGNANASAGASPGTGTTRQK